MFDAVTTARVVVPRDAVVSDVGERIRIPASPCWVLCEPRPLYDESASLTVLVTRPAPLQPSGQAFPALLLHCSSAGRRRCCGCGT